MIKSSFGDVFFQLSNSCRRLKKSTMAGAFGRVKKQVGSLYTDPFRCEVIFAPIWLFIFFAYRWGMVKSIGLFALGIYLAR